VAKPKYQIFVSSTYEDLKEERDTVIKAILETGNIPVGMEMFSAGDEQQWELIKRQIEDCDYYVVILAHRYGSMDGIISYTEKEYDFAVEKKIPVLGFVIDDGANWPKKKMDTDPAVQQALAAFKEKVKRKMVVFWKNGDQLHGQVAIALSKAFTAYPRVGWVRAGEDVGPGVTNELSRLSKENAELRQVLTDAGLQMKNDEEIYKKKVVAVLISNKRTVTIRLANVSGCQKEITLRRLFVILGRRLVVDTNISSLSITLANVLRKSAQKIKQDAKFPVPRNHVEDILADLAALGLVELSSAQFSDKSEGPSWVLTDFGKKIDKELRQIVLFEALDKVGSSLSVEAEAIGTDGTGY